MAFISALVGILTLLGEFSATFGLAAAVVVCVVGLLELLLAIRNVVPARRR